MGTQLSTLVVNNRGYGIWNVLEKICYYYTLIIKKRVTNDFCKNNNYV